MSVLRVIVFIAAAMGVLVGPAWAAEAGATDDGTLSAVYHPGTGEVWVEDQGQTSPSANILVLDSAGENFTTGIIGTYAPSGSTVADEPNQIGWIAPSPYDNNYGDGQMVGAVLPTYWSSSEVLADLSVQYSRDSTEELLVGDVIRILEGDTDADFDVDFTDFNNLSNGFGSGTTWAEGDTDGDGDVDFTDFNNLANNFGAAYAPGVPGDLDADEVELVVDITTGEMKLVSGGAVDLNGYSITSASGTLIADADGSASPFMFYLSNTASEVAAGSVGSQVTLDGELALDAGFAGDQDLAFEYGTADGTFAGDIQYVPEPATLSLLAIGGACALIRRKRA